MSIDTMDCETWIDSTLIDRDDRKVGTIEAIYFDEDSGQPQWMAVAVLERLDDVSPAPVDA